MEEFINYLKNKDKFADVTDTYISDDMYLPPLFNDILPSEISYAFHSFDSISDVDEYATLHIHIYVAQKDDNCIVLLCIS